MIVFIKRIDLFKVNCCTLQNGICTGEEVLLYVTLLREEGRYPEALERLHKFASSNASALPPLEHNRPSEKYGLLTCLSTEEKLGLETDILCESGNLIGARSRVCDLLDQFSDQWLYYLKYITLTEVTL